MKKRKRVFVIAALVVLLGIGWWYLFWGSRKKAPLVILWKGLKNTGALSSTMCSILSVKVISITMSTFPKAMTAANPMLCILPCRATKDCIFRESPQTIQSEEYGFEARKYNEKMIIVAPQLSDWGETSANQTIALVEYFLEAYNIDQNKVYGNGFSGVFCHWQE